MEYERETSHNGLETLPPLRGRTLNEALADIVKKKKVTKPETKQGK